MFDDRMTLAEAADYIGVTDRCMYAWYEQDRGPRGYKLGGRIWYHRSDIDEWANAQMAATTRGGVR